MLIPLDSLTDGSRQRVVADGHDHRVTAVTGELLERQHDAGSRDHPHVLVDGEPLRTGLSETLEAPRHEDVRRRGNLAHEGPEELTLTLRAPDVALGVGVTGSDVTERRRAVHVLAALLEVDVCLRVVHVVLDADVDATDGVDDRREAAEADLHVVVDVDARVLLDRLDEQRRVTEGERRVDLVLAVAGDVDVAVPGDRHEGRLVAAHVQHHDRVRALALGGAGAELLALLRRQTCAGVGTDEQDVLALAVFREMLRGDGVELLHLAPGRVAGPDESADPEDEQGQDTGENLLPPTPRAVRGLP